MAEFHQEHHGKTATLHSWKRFPRYLFVEFDAADRTTIDWVPLKHTPGVREILMKPNGEPHALQPGTIEQIAAAEFAERNPPPGKRRRKSRTDLAPGDIVRLERHENWTGFNGQLLAVNRRTATIMMASWLVVVPAVDLSLTARGNAPQLRAYA